MVRDDDSSDPIVKMRGLPWSATVDDIIKFLDDANVKDGKNGVHITMSREGRPSGEAFVELETMEDVEKALKKDKENMGHRYIEIFKTSRHEVERFIAKGTSNVDNTKDECCVMLRGLPYGCTEDDIKNFFPELTIVPNGISFISSQTGRNIGAYVQFLNKDMADSAPMKHLDRMGHRYIEIYRYTLPKPPAQNVPKIPSLMSELVPRPVPYDRGDRFGGPNRMAGAPPPPLSRLRAEYAEDDDWEGGGGGGNRGWGGNVRKPGPPRDASIPSLAMKNRLSPPPAARVRSLMYGNGKGSGLGGWEEEEQRYMVHMRGLPYKATEQDIMTFFRPLIPINVQITYDKTGRPSGEANVEFETFEDANRAMAKDKQNMNNRYIELFLRATPPNKSSSLSGRSSSSRSLGGFGEDVKPEPLLFSRRGGGSGPGSMSNSAYDGFYGTSLYRSSSGPGGQRF